jgi:hypothetical protein
VPAVLAGLAGCGGSPDPPDEPPRLERRAVSGGLRSPDARSPFTTAGDGVWRCPTARRIQLDISAGGEVSLSTPGMVLASVAPTRALVNRACEAGRRLAGPRAASAARRGRVGATVVRCDARRTVLVDFGDGDVTVHTTGGRFLAAAAVRPDRIGVAGYWGVGCALSD